MLGVASSSLCNCVFGIDSGSLRAVCLVWLLVACGVTSLLHYYSHFMAKFAQIGRPRESSVWDYFLYNEEEGKSICQVIVGEGGSICGKEINGRYPTNLKAHSKHSHPIQHAQVQQKVKRRRKKKRRLGINLMKDLHGHS